VQDANKIGFLFQASVTYNKNIDFFMF
jgi:hypothetical protein